MGTIIGDSHCDKSAQIAVFGGRLAKGWSGRGNSIVGQRTLRRGAWLPAHSATTVLYARSLACAEPSMPANSRLIVQFQKYLRNIHLRPTTLE